MSGFLATEHTVFNGYLQVDGYAAYQRVNDKLVGCWAHARRKFKVKERLYFRRTHSSAQLTTLKQWLDKSVQQVSKQSALGRAIHYTINQWPKLSRYLEDGRLNIDNNRAERAVKPFVIGRKNWLFNHNHRGAEASAILYSIIETAKANGLTPFDYIERCLEQLSHPNCDLSSLLPWRVKLGKA
ncbi:hypothetical protein KT99_14390 [Shewanella benthica KT99]|uniref:Uncharacterized protein n=1 Tax=Shewanella benthica KT99 TaxID=314608 RepID=A9DLL1_9GAMM|nr:hypothetical protein KT99_14390 [Shewanella benthica KT99]